MIKPPPILSHKDPFFGLRILQPNEDPSLPPKRILNYKDGSELVYIPPGPFMMGDDELNKERKDCPRHEVNLDGYYMAVWPVTNKQYRRFMRETGHRAPEGESLDGLGVKRVWEGTQLLPGYEEHPVVCVAWHEAEAYAKWATLRLPSEAEWEKAAGGPEGLKYPWGNVWEEGRCRHFGNRGEGTTAEVKEYALWLFGLGRADGRREGTTAEVKEYVSGVSAYGCEQMSGNVSEWCGDRYRGEYYRESERRNPTGPEAGIARVYRGGSWRDAPRAAQVADRGRIVPFRRLGYLGFRLSRSFP